LTGLAKIIEMLSGLLSGGPAGGGLFLKRQNRHLVWLLGVAALGVILMLAAGGSVKKDVAARAVSQPETVTQLQSLSGQAGGGMTAVEEDLNKSLCAMLKQIKGAGKVEVFVRLADSGRSDYAVNNSTGKKTTQERDQSGGTRVTTEDTGSGQLVMVRGSQGIESPVLERENAPRVAGVLVVAEGAGNARVKTRLFEAVRVALGIEPHKILVLSRERGE